VNITPPIELVVRVLVVLRKTAQDTLLLSAGREAAVLSFEMPAELLRKVSDDPVYVERKKVIEKVLPTGEGVRNQNDTNNVVRTQESKA
jgi:hypothetical protein